MSMYVYTCQLFTLNYNVLHKIVTLVTIQKSNQKFQIFKQIYSKYTLNLMNNDTKIKLNY